mmetsp:Transcript_76636/g.211707  ORF Transcript_76636/g.211707 Transcript_76636/m.211707 type:complete len:111 (+) Transcript_76636:57-389(+)
MARSFSQLLASALALAAVATVMPVAGAAPREGLDAPGQPQGGRTTLGGSMIQTVARITNTSQPNANATLLASDSDGKAKGSVVDVPLNSELQQGKGQVVPPKEHPSFLKK